MADKKISALTGATTPLAGTEVLPIVQSSTTVKVATNDLTVRNVRANATTGILQVTGPTAASTRVMTVPDANFTAARTDAAQSFTGDQTFATGNLIIGTSGKGIDFSATSHPAGMTSELFSDYEEGTWTPVYSPETGSFTTMTMEVENAVYTKVGRLVTVSAYVATGNVDATGASGGLLISGLPFTSNIRTAAYLSRTSGFTGDFPLSGYVDLSATAVQLYYRLLVNIADVKMDVSDLQTGSGGNRNVVVFSTSYTTA
jgi:hypothetical protein